MTSFEAYCLFHALKLHFTTDYDFVKYHGKVRLTEESYEKAKGKVFYKRLAGHGNPKDLIVSAFKEGKAAFVGDLFSPDALDRYTQHKRRVADLPKLFEADLKKVPDPFLDQFAVKEHHDYPPMFVLFQQKQITMETLVILDIIGGLFSAWDKAIEDKFLYPKARQRCLKYKPFLPTYEKPEMVKIFKNRTGFSLTE